MTNLYHILHKQPYLEKEDMPIELEDLAVRLVNSGLLRIDADEKINFARFSLPRIDFFCTFTKRQLFQENLLQQTIETIKYYLKFDQKIKNIESEAKQYLSKLKYQLTTAVPVNDDLELKIARLIVQLAHPVVIELILIEQVEIYISYGYTIGDVLSISSWQHNGNNNGMQSLDGRSVAIYVSCNGDPFFVQKKEKIDKNNKNVNQDKREPEELTYGNGQPALARMIIVGGQEFGHYSDLIRVGPKKYTSRHAADIYCSNAKPHVKRGRIDDMAWIYNIKQHILNMNFLSMIRLEKDILFYRKQKVKNFRVYLIKIFYFLRKKYFMYKVIKLYPAFKEVYKFRDPINMLSNLFEDMMFNLEPKADVYSHPNPNVEEAIACVEALARVPQQCNKWGHKVVQLLYPNLYEVYYKEVIPQCIKDYQKITNSKFMLYRHNFTYIPRYKFYFIKLKKYLRKKFSKSK